MSNQLQICSIILLVIITSIQSYGQDCDIAPVVEQFHANQIRATVTQSGNIFFNYPQSDPGLFVPYSGPNSSSGYYSGYLYLTGRTASGILTGVGGDMFDFDPGPLRGELTLDCRQSEFWNKIFFVSGQAILQHINDASDGVIDHPINEVFGWPAHGNSHFESVHGFNLELGEHGGAHFIEKPGHENGIYEPQYGEYPHVENLPRNQIPDQISWHVYNNSKSQEDYLLSENKMICEVQECYYAFSCPGNTKDLTLFQQFKITNTGNYRISDLATSLVLDPDLGCYADDYIGTNSRTNTMYTYNGDSLRMLPSIKCPYPAHSGIQTAQTMTFLNHDMSSSTHFYLGSANFPNRNMLSPFTIKEHRNYAQAKWKNGVPVTNYGNGYNISSTDTTFFIFSDSPNQADGWSMKEKEMLYEGVEYRSVSTTTQDILEPGESMVLDIAYVFHGDSNLNNWQIVDKALENIYFLLQDYDSKISKCQLLSANCQDVWPGDANADGIVNYLDFIPIFLSQGETGPRRNNPFPFIPQEVADWNSSTLPGINTKYADVDGNGIINENDNITAEQYIDMVNFCYTNNTPYCENGDDVYIEISPSDTLKNGPTRGGIYLRNMDNIAGFSCVFKTNLEVIGLYANSSVEWLDPSLHEQEYVDYTRENQGEIKISVIASNSKNNPLKNRTDNKLISLYGRYIPVQSYPHRQIRLSICDFTLYYEDGSSKKLPTMHKDLYLPDDVVITSTSSIDQNAPTFFPNPSEGFLHVHSEKTYNFALFDQHGIQIKKGVVAKGASELDFSNVVNGFYLIKFWHENLSYMQKVIIQK